MKVEDWLGHQIRFVEKDGEWWAVAKDVADALGFRDAFNATLKMKPQYRGTAKVSTTSDKAKCPDTQEMIVLNEKGLYRLIMRSNKPEAEAFQDWVYEVLKQLRAHSGLEGFQIFRMLDKEHTRMEMRRLCDCLKSPARVDFIKANNIANKAVSTRHGHLKMLKKSDMTPEMLVERQPILEDTVTLMGMVDKFSLPVSVSQAIYDKYAQQAK